MRVFVDTNILIDVIGERGDFSEDAECLFAFGVLGKVKLVASALSYVTAMYVAHKYKYMNARESLVAMSRVVEVLDLKGETVVDMLSSSWKDYEDAVQNQGALEAGADCIVTRNTKDFVASSLPVYTTKELIKELIANEDGE